MSSTLAMILATGMTVPGIGPEKVSGEIEQRLDLRGKWEGYHFLLGGEFCRVKLQGEELRVELSDGRYVTHEIEFTDKGRGSVHIILAVGGVVTFRYRGVYRYEGDRLVICYGKPGISKDTSFSAEIGQHFLIIRRVKSGK